MAVLVPGFRDCHYRRGRHFPETTVLPWRKRRVSGRLLENSGNHHRRLYKMLSRITAIGAVALALGMGLAPVRASESAFQKRDVLADCLSKAGVPTDSPGSDDYKLDMSPFNLRLNYTPVAIAVPTTVQHIQNAVACAAKLGVKANAKGGGHSYASFGLGGTDGHLVIELDRMNAVVLNNSSGVASVEGGSRLGHVASELLAQGNRGFSHGTCPG